MNNKLTFTYNDLQKAFEDGKLYGDGELPLIDNFDFTDKPELTAFDVWFNNFLKLTQKDL